MNIDHINNNSLINYPCKFPLKIIGKNCKEFSDGIYTVIKNFYPDFDLSSINSQLSKSGKYIGLTITIHVLSRNQLDCIYKDLCNSPFVSFVL